MCVCMCDGGIPLSRYPMSHPGPNYKSGLTCAVVTRRTRVRTKTRKLWLNQAHFASLLHTCVCIHIADRSAFVSSLCVDRFVEIVTMGTGVWQKKNKDSWLINEV